MADLKQIIYRLQNDQTQRDELFEKLQKDNYYPDKTDNKTITAKEQFINDLTTYDNNNLTPKQKYLASEYQGKSDKQTNIKQGWKWAGLAGAMLLTALAYSSFCMPNIKGTESHVQSRITNYETQNEKYKRFHNGQNAPWYKNMETIVQEESEKRTVNKKTVMGLSGLLLLLGGAALTGYGIREYLRGKKTQ